MDADRGEFQVPSAKFRLGLLIRAAHSPCMESHEWRERTDEGLRYFRANYQGGRWTFLTTLKTDPDWEIVHPVPVELWRELRDILWRK
ncbi:MAG: hypothetical protein CFE26_04095 [Verrucomicrobiales bacterium VVV1]|nr:MAG: hypothetical protein CFE26_04095 [Verrucomicrobiales bacterium VVV1]